MNKAPADSIRSYARSSTKVGRTLLLFLSENSIFGIIIHYKMYTLSTKANAALVRPSKATRTPSAHGVATRSLSSIQSLSLTVRATHCRYMAYIMPSLSAIARYRMFECRPPGTTSGPRIHPQA